MQKTNLRQFFFVMLEVNRNGLYQGGSLEKFKEKNFAKVNFLKTLTKGNLLKCFH